MITIHHPCVFAFGIIGNIVSLMVFLAPLPTFIRVYKKKSTEGFESLPYVVAIFSAMLWIYYSLLKGNSFLLITINIAGVIIETVYVAIYVTYAPRQARNSTLKLLMLMNFCGYCAIILVTHYLFKGQARLQVFGWICVVISISVYAAPLTVMKTVIRTKSVEYMPFNLSFCLTLTATIWFLYGFAQKDLYVTLPNVVGFVFGVVQMALYLVYSKYDKEAQKQKLPEVVVAIPVKQDSIEIHKINSIPNKKEDVIPPHQQPQEFEVIVIVKNNNEDIGEDEDKLVEVAHDDKVVVQQEDSFNGPLHGPSTCNVEAEKIVVGGPGPLQSAVQLVQCAV